MILDGNSFVNPDYGYKMTFDLMIEPVKLSNGEVRIYDNGIQNDIVKLECDIVLERNDAIQLDKIIREDLLNKTFITLQGENDFKPFFMDTVDIVVEEYNYDGMIDDFGNWVKKNMTIGLITELYIIEEQGWCKWGNVTILGIDGLTFVRSDIDIAFNQINYVYKGINKHSTIYPVDFLGREKTIAVEGEYKQIKNLLNRMRANRGRAIEITTPDNYLYWGNDITDLSISCNLVNPKITVTHLRYNWYRMEFEAAYMGAI